MPSTELIARIVARATAAPTFTGSSYSRLMMCGLGAAGYAGTASLPDRPRQGPDMLRLGPEHSG
jgi:hypothetical protein